MKAFLSVFALAARSTLFKIWGLTLAVSAVETGLIFRAAAFAPKEVRAEDIFYDSFSGFFLFAGLIGVLLILVSAFRSKGANQPLYTLHRLRVSPAASIGSVSLFCVISILFYGAIQIALYWWLCKRLAETGIILSEGHAAFLAFCRFDPLYGLFPMGSPILLLRNLVLLLDLSLITACSCLADKSTRKPPVHSLFNIQFLLTFSVLQGRSVATVITTILMAATSVLVFVKLTKGGFNFEKESVV